MPEIPDIPEAPAPRKSVAQSSERRELVVLTEAVRAEVGKKLEIEPDTWRFMEKSQGVQSFEKWRQNLSQIGKMLDVQRFLLYRVEGDTATILMVSSDADDIESVGDRFPIESNPNILQAVRTNEPSQIPVPGIGIDAAFPIGLNGMVLGVDNTDAAREFTENELAILQLVASSTILAHDAGHFISLLGTDRLTGLPNRLAFNAAIDEGQDIFGKPIPAIETAAFLDLDHFKETNDTFGHDAGDAVLTHYTKVMGERVRKLWGTLFRIGGEEFVASFPTNVTYDEIDSIRTAAENSPCMYEGLMIKKTVSIGFARRNELPAIEQKGHDTKDSKRLIRIADKALYVAKKILERNVTAKETERKHG